MKGNTRNKDQSTEEGTGKRPKRKCLQWHPLLANKLLDFSEDEEEEDDDIDKVPLVDVDGLEHDVDEAEDNDSPEQRARRPMNAFLLFCKRHRSLVRQEHPRLDNRGATKILADWWAYLDPNEKQKYTDMAKEYKDAFMKANPGYKWCPATNKPVKATSPTVTNRKKTWTFPTEAVKDLPISKTASKDEEMPQINFGIADPTQMGGLSMLLLAGEHALTAQGDHGMDTQVESSVTEMSPSACLSNDSNSSEPSRKSELFRFAETSSGTSHAEVLTPAKQCENSAWFQFAEISSNTSKINSLEPTKRCGKSALFHLAEISSSTSHSDSPASTKQCGTSALFQLAEMCVASEAVKIEISGNVANDCLDKVPKSVCIKDPHLEEADEDVVTSSQNTYTHISEKNDFGRSKIKRQGLHSPDVSDAEFLEFLKREKVKKKKKKNKANHDTSEKGSLKKSPKKRQSSESDIESVMYTIEAVAKGDWGLEKSSVSQSKNICSASPNHTFFDLKPVKKKVKAKEKKVLKGSMDRPLATTTEVMVPEPTTTVPTVEMSTEVPDCIKEEELSPIEELPPVCSPELLKSEDCDIIKKIESCGSRKSERACKGALYKTLVSEGMLTSLRANVDRGKRNSLKGNSSDHECCWNEESWVYNQSGSSGSKKLKKSKSKEESTVGLAKLEEEFEKKFNSLPQYSPVTFDRKNLAVPRKKKKPSSGQIEQQKTSKGSFQSQKKLFHKIVSKYKHKKDKQSILDKAILEDKNTADNSVKSSNCAPVPYIPETTAIQEPLVGSQKRKARKNKITHLVRNMEGQTSSRNQTSEEKRVSDRCQELCINGGNCRERIISGDAEVEQNHSINHDMPAVSAFFSLAALAEVAAMENVHRSSRTALSRDGQKKEISQNAVLISCADQ